MITIDTMSIFGNRELYRFVPDSVFEQAASAYVDGKQSITITAQTYVQIFGNL